MRTTIPTAAAALLLVAGPLAAQDTPRAVEGPVIHGWGATFAIPDPGFATPTDARYRVVFDVSQSSATPGQVNPHINTLARFLNMHARAGVPRENMELALVLHGEAAKDALLEEPFRRRFGVENQNLGLLRALADAGVRVYMCGQSAASRSLAREELAEPVVMALSAMTAMWALQEEGYRRVN